MKQTSLSNGIRNEVSFQVCAAGSRILIALTALLLLIMPFTAYFWNFDKFLHGGQDFEFGLLTLAAIFLLTLLFLMQHHRSGLLDSASLLRSARCTAAPAVPMPRTSGSQSLVSIRFEPFPGHLPLKI